MFFELHPYYAIITYNSHPVIYKKTSTMGRHECRKKLDPCKVTQKKCLINHLKKSHAYMQEGGTTADCREGKQILPSSPLAHLSPSCPTRYLCSIAGNPRRRRRRQDDGLAAPRQCSPALDDGILVPLRRKMAVLLHRDDARCSECSTEQR
jgi:hypothetical protein